MSEGNEIITPMQIELDAKISLQDVTDIVVSETEENLLLERETLEANLMDASKKHQQAQDHLIKLASGLAKKAKPPKVATDLAAMKNKFDKEKNRFKKDAKASKHVAKVQEENSTTNIEEQFVSVTVSVHNENGNSYSRETESIQVRLDFTPQMKKAVEVIEARVKDVKGIQEELKATKRKLSDLPRMARRAKAEVTKAQLRGELDSGEAILERVMGVPVKALPSYRS